MRKLMTAATPSEAVALIGINACVAQTNVQTADVKNDFPVDEIDSDDWTPTPARTNARPRPAANCASWRQP